MTDGTNLPVGILCKQDIKSAIKDYQLITDTDEEDCFQPCSYDLRIGTIFRDGQIINEYHEKANSKFIIPPGEIVSIATLEEIRLPNDVAATAFPINSQSRKGLMVLNPGHVDPGFNGFLTVKVINLRKVPLPISRGDKIFTIIFEGLPKPVSDPYTSNNPRHKREGFISQQDLEVSPKSLYEIIKISKDETFTTKQDVKNIITTHWISILTIILAIVAALASIIAVILSFKSSNSNSAPIIIPYIDKQSSLKAGDTYFDTMMNYEIAEQHINTEIV